MSPAALAGRQKRVHLKKKVSRAIEGVGFELSAENPMMDQKNKIFSPHLLPILALSTVDSPDTDDVRRRAYAREGSANMFNLESRPS